MNALIGRPESQAVALLGGPSSVYAAPTGERVLTFRQDRNYYIPPTPNHAGGLSGQAIAGVCIIDVTVQNGSVYRWNARGNDCAL